MVSHEVRSYSMALGFEPSSAVVTASCDNSVSCASIIFVPSRSGERVGFVAGMLLKLWLSLRVVRSISLNSDGYMHGAKLCQRHRI